MGASLLALAKSIYYSFNDAGVFELVLKKSRKSKIIQIKFHYTAEIKDGNLFLIYAL